MTESTLDTVPSTKASAEDSSASNNLPPAYPYSQILQQLQSKAIQAQDPVSSSNKEKVESSNTTTTTRHSQSQTTQPWDLSADALLATLLHEFSSHVASRSHHVASDIRQLQNSINESGVNVAICQTEFMKRSNEIFMEQVVGDDESESELEGDEVDDNKGIKPKGEQNNGQEDDGEDDGEDDDDIDDNSSADIARLEREEQSAIADGMKALELFFDPKRPNKSSGDGGDDGGEGDTMIDVEEDIIGENCYYYPSAEADGFNQRPLPFIVGSREFMESSCAGLGGDIGVGGVGDE